MNPRWGCIFMPFTALATLAAVAALALALAGQAPSSLEGVLRALDAAAPGIHSVSAKITLNDYTALVHSNDRSSGMLYFEHQGNRISYSLDLTRPRNAARRLMVVNGFGWYYVPSAKQVTKRALGANQDLLQYLLVGMGATGADLNRLFAITFDGPVQFGKADAVKLTLVPRDPKASATYPKIELWLNPGTWLPAAEQLWQQGGDYHLLVYSETKLNRKLDPKIFSTDFPGATVVVQN